MSITPRVSPPPVRRPVVAALALLLAAVAPAAARADASAVTPHATARLLLGAADATAGRALPMALRLVLAPGWHTYWRNPGDAGLPPTVAVRFDGGASRPATLGFPPPVRIDEGGLVGFGYTGDVVFPFSAVAPAGSSPLAVTVQASFLVCREVCVPVSATLSATLPRAASAAVPASGTAVAASPADGDAAAIAAAERALPRTLPVAAAVSARGVLRVRGAILGPDTVSRAAFFPDQPGLIDNDAPQTLAVTPGVLTLRLHPTPDLAHADGLAGVLVLADRDGQETAIRLDARRGEAAPPAPSTAGAARAAGGHDLVALALLALLGGLVLNAMPCVFPVLAMKAMALTRAAADHDRRKRRRSALLYAAGTVGSLLLLGGALLALRAAGSGVAWGFQFQSAPVVAATALLLFAVGLNLLDVFAVGGGRVAGLGQGAIARGGAAADLLAGALAVLVATPCTAPFMGAALVGALAGPPAAALVVFAALGVGLASPMLLLGMLPGVERLFPRPGPWMATLRHVLAFPMFAASLWMVWVVSVEVGPAGVLRVGASLLLFGAAVAAWRFARHRAGLLAALACGVASLAILPTLRTAGDASPAGGAAVAGVEPYTASRLAALTEAGRPVLVDMSAAWCLTCLVNERVALDPAAVRHALLARGVVVLRGDWTRSDPAITAFLRRFGRDGVPLVVFFPAGRPPVVLPQILTPGDVLAATAEPARAASTATEGPRPG